MAELEAVAGDPFAASQSSPLTPVEGNPFAASVSSPPEAAPTAGLTPVASDPFSLDKPEAGLTPVNGNPFGGSPAVTASANPDVPTSEPPAEPAAAPPPQTPDEHWAVTRGLVGGMLHQNPELTAYGLEAISHAAPDMIGEPLRDAAKSLKKMASLSPKEYEPQAKGFFDSMQGGLGPALTWAGETFGSGLASTVPSVVAGLAGAGAGAGAGALVGGPVGAGVGATAGGVLGAIGPSYVLNAGETYKALLDEKIDPKLASQYARWAAVPMAVLDTASVGPIIARLGGLKEVKRELTRDIARRIASEGAHGATREGVTEAAQEAIKIAAVSLATDKPFWSMDNVDAISGSLVGGALVGGGLGGVTGIKQDVVKPRDATPEEIARTLQNIQAPGAGTTTVTINGQTQTVSAPSEMIDQPKWYYSQVAKTALEKLPNVASPEQIISTLQNSPGVKQEEIEALGIPAFLAEAGGKVSKKDLIAHIEENAVNLETVDTQERLPKVAWQEPQDITSNPTFVGFQKQIGAPVEGMWTAPTLNGWAVIKSPLHQKTAPSYWIVKPNGYITGVAYPTLEAAQGSLTRQLFGENETQYGGWTTPGGDNYREVKLTLPVVAKDPAALARFDELDGKASRGEMSIPENDEYARLRDRLKDIEGGYQGGHFDEANIVAHFRAKDRTDVEGKRGLGIEEIQSDWHQQGRNLGYIGREASHEVREVPGGFGIFNKKENRQVGMEKTKSSAEAYVRNLNEIGVPNAPFKTSWPELALKRILRMAADEGHDRVYIMPGSEQAIRYRQTGAEAAGQKEFYDNIIPRLMEKWAKKLGGKTGITQIEVPRDLNRQDVQEGRKISVRYIDLTPAMQTRIQGGLPLFSGKVGEVQTFESAAVQKIPMTPQVEALKAATRQAAIPIGQLAKKMGINIPIALQIDGTSQYLGMLNPHYDANGKLQAATIHISLMGHSTAQEIFATLAHEFGHLIHRAHWTEASNVTKMKINLAWEQWYEQNRGERDLNKILKTRDNFLIESYNTRSVNKTKGFIDIMQMTPERRNYWLSFDEWFAEQAAKWITTDARPLSFVDKFFAGLGKKIREVYGFFRLRFGDIGEPHKFVAEWLNSLLTEIDVTSQVVVSALEKRGQQINQSAFNADGTPGFPAEPMTGATILPRQLMASLNLGSHQSTMTGAAAADRFNKFYHYMLSMVQLAARNLHIPELQRYRELWQIKQLERTQIMDGALTTLKGWRKLDSAQQDAVAGLIDDYMNLEFLTPAEKQAGVSRRPSQAEFAKLVQDNKVNSQGIVVFEKVVKDFDDMLTRYGEILIAKANEITDPIQQAVRLQEIGTQLANLRKQPYFPAMRFGDYTITVRNAANQVIHFETFESARKRKSAAEVISPKLANGEQMQLGFLSKEARPMVGMPPGLLDSMAAKLSLSPAQRGALEQLRFDMSPAQSFKHRFQKKSRVAGYSSDFMRAYANYFFHGSNYFTNIKYIDQLTDQVRAVRDSADKMYDGTKRKQISNFLSEHLAYMLDPKPDFAALRGLAFLWYLGYSPAAAAINMTQMLIGTYPLLASKFGDIKTAGAMLKAGSKLSTYYRKATLAGATALELKAINEGVKEGVITEAMAPELAAISEGRNLQKGFGGNLVEKSWQRFSEWSSKMFEMTEQMNRRITFRAAFRLALDNPAAPYVQESIAKHKLQYDKLRDPAGAGWADHEAAAFVVAKDAVETTQYIYQNYAQPRFTRGHLKSVFIFKTFLQNTLFMLWNYPAAAARSILIMAFLGGLMGLPGTEDLRGILKGLAWRLFGKDFDLEDEARKFILDVVGDKVAPDTILHGMSRTGFGIPMIGKHLGFPLPEFDMSKSIGMGQISPVDIGALLGPGSQRDTSRSIADATQRASGAIYGTGFNLYKALSDGALSANDFKRWERVMPREAASLSKAYRAMSEGRERDRRGNTVVRYDVTDTNQMMSAIELAMGLQPSKLTAQWDKRIAQMEAIQFWDLRRTGLLNQLWAARGDKEDYSRVLGAVRKFNLEVAETDARGKAISADTISRSFQTRARGQQATESGTPRVKADIPIARGVQRLYPEADVDVRPVK